VRLHRRNYGRPRSRSIAAPAKSMVAVTSAERAAKAAQGTAYESQRSRSSPNTAGPPRRPTTIDAKATLGGMTGVHQFVRIGAFAFIGGMAKVTKDIPPYVRADGNPARLFGLNVIGLQRNGFTRETLDELKKAYRLFFRSNLIIKQAIARARSELAALPEVEVFVGFIEASERGVAV